MTPFIILALPRSGTHMLLSGLLSHPDIENIIHEFREGEDEFLRHPQILSNYVKPWMKSPIIHMYREDACAGARSMLLMHYVFPAGVVTLPESEVIALAKDRKEWDEEMRQAADYSFSYESLLKNGMASAFPASFSDKFCDHVGLERHTLTTTTGKNLKLQLRNEESVQCLSA